MRLWTRSIAVAWAAALCACAPELTTSGDCDALVFDGTLEMERDDLDILFVLDATGRVSRSEQADLIVRVLQPIVTGHIDAVGSPEIAAFADVRVAFAAGGLSAGCDEEAAIALDTCGELPFIAFGRYGTPPRPTFAEVETAVRCAVALDRPRCATHQPFVAAARVLADSAAEPTGFRRIGAELIVMSVGGVAACDEPSGYLDDRDLLSSLGAHSRYSFAARLCTEADVVDVESNWLASLVGRIVGVCLPRAVRHDDAGLPACEVLETIAWPDPNACSALAALGREPIAVQVDARGHATCRLRPGSIDGDGVSARDDSGFYVDDRLSSRMYLCGSGGTFLAVTNAAEPLPGSTLHVHCLAAASTCE